MENSVMTHEELRLRVELLIQQKILTEQRISALAPQVEQIKKELRHVDATDGHIKRLRKLDEKRELLIAQKNQIEHDLYNTKSDLMEIERVDRKSYAGKAFCMEFVEVAKERLPAELYRHIKDEAIRRARVTQSAA
jgi:chaperonin cofactor prefoldin